MFAELVCIALAVCLLFCESVKGRLADAMSIEALLGASNNAESLEKRRINNWIGLHKPSARTKTRTIDMWLALGRPLVALWSAS
jgi:hypothetical protein